MTVNRREVLGMLAGSSLALAAPVAARAQSQVPDIVRIGVVPVEVCAQVFYGLDLGFFRKAGLDVRLEWFTNPGAIATALIGNAIDAGLFDSVGAITAHARNIPLVFLAAGKLFDEHDPPFGTIVPMNSPLHTAKDFAGTFAVSSVNNIALLTILAWIDRNGGDSKRVKFVEMPFPSMVPALERGTVDGALAVEPWLSNATDKGLRTIWPHNVMAPSFVASGCATTRAWAEAHPAIADRVTRVLYEAGRWGNRHHDASTPIIVKYTKLPSSTVAKMHRGAFAESTNVALLQPVIETAVKYDIIAKPFPAAELFYRAST